MILYLGAHRMTPLSLNSPDKAIYTIQWNISFKDASNISRNPIRKQFFTPYDGVVLEWTVSFSADINFDEVVDGNFDEVLGLFYSGPIANITAFISMCSISKDKRSRNVFLKKEIQAVAKSVTKLMHISTLLGDKLEDVCHNSGHFQIVLEIPTSAFSFSYIEHGPSTFVPDWMINLHSNIETPESKDFDVQLIAKDGKSFYCHKVVLNSQSTVFEAMFRNATTDEEKSGTFRFRSLNSNVFRRIIEYLYIGKPNLDAIAAPDLMAIADFAEQYGLKSLKGAAARNLWVSAIEEPNESIDIARFGDLHADEGFAYLKYRCFEVMAKKYDDLGLKMDELFQDSEEPVRKKMRVDGESSKVEDQGTKLREEFAKYLRLRVEPTFY